MYVKEYLPRRVKPYRWVLLVHGMGEHHKRYLPLIREFLKGGVAVIGVDLPGHGQSRGPRGHIPSIEDVAKTIKRHLPPPDRNIFAVGHSIGALIVVRMLQMFPYTFDRVVLSSPGLLVKPPGIALHLLGEFASVFLPGLSLPLLPVEKFGRNSAELWMSDQSLHKKISGTTYMEMHRQVAEAWLAMDMIDVPCLMMVGDKDPLIDHSLTDRLLKRWGKCTIKVYDAYHDIITDPQTSEQAIRDILRFLDISPLDTAEESPADELNI